LGKVELALGQNGVLKVPFGTIRENEINCVDGRNSRRSGRPCKQRQVASCFTCMCSDSSASLAAMPGPSRWRFKARMLQHRCAVADTRSLVRASAAAVVYQNLGGTRGKTLADVQTLMLAVRCCGGIELALLPDYCAVCIRSTSRHSTSSDNSTCTPMT